MGRSTIILLPALQQRLADIGENLRLARLRRQLSADQVSERAGITRPTLRAIERGDASVSFGAYANVLFCLGLEQDLSTLAHDDELGRKLQDAHLGVKRRAPRRPRAIAEAASSRSPKKDAS
jgi:transcriptional regulator with XRE-family HTH domain